MEPVVGDLVEIGVDILNPVQPECVDIVRLKREFGDRLSFWGGIGVQTVMPFGSPTDVYRAVETLIRAAGPTGLVVAPSHLIERDIPWANVMALRAAVHELDGPSHGTPARRPDRTPVHRYVLQRHAL